MKCTPNIPRSTGGKYSATLTGVAPKPGSITVRSSAGGSATRNVALK